jgi:predicted DCC family thiol-disulfide oxidoreductase YuxK
LSKSEKQTTGLDPSGDALSGLPQRIVFFDGVCSFCDGVVTWLRNRDPEDRLFFASLQGETADRFRRIYPGEFPPAVDNMVYFTREDTGAGSAVRIHQRADAVLALCDELGGVWRHARWLRALPAGWLDVAYRIFAANRYRLFGTLDACAIPTPEQRKQLLP